MGLEWGAAYQGPVEVVSYQLSGDWPGLSCCRLCLLSAKGTRPNPDSALPDLLYDVSKQQVARL